MDYTAALHQWAIDVSHKFSVNYCESLQTSGFLFK